MATASKTTSKVATKAKTTPTSAANGKQRTISVSGKTVVSNGRVVGQYKTTQEAQAAAQKYVTGSSKNYAGKGVTGEAAKKTAPVKTVASSGSTAGATFSLPTNVSSSRKSSSSPKKVTGAGDITDAGAQTVETSVAGMKKKKDRPVVERNMAAEQQALADALKSTSEGGANQGIANGTDIPSYLEKNPGFRDLLQEQVNMRVYGSGKPTFKEAPTVAASSDTADDSASYETADTTEGEDVGDIGNLDVNDWLTKFGVDQNTKDTTTADTTADDTGIDSEMESLANDQYNLDNVEATYKSNLDSIQARYDQERQQAQTAAENRLGERMSELASLGGNPSSSAGASLENEKQLLLQKFMSDISMRESQEKSAAMADYSNQRNAAIAGKMGYLQNKKEGISKAEQTKYDRSQDSLTNAISILNATLNAAQTKQSLSQTDKNNTIKSFETLFNNFGSSAFDGATPADMRSFEKALGLSSGTLKSAIAKFKEAELKSKEVKPELREVDGSLYQLSWDDASQTYVPVILVKKQAKATSGGGSGGGGGTVTIGGQPIESSVVNAAKAAWQAAYGDSYASLAYLSDKDKLAEVVSSFLYNGGSSTFNPFAENRAGAEEEYGSGGNSVWDFLDEGGDSTDTSAAEPASGGSASSDIWSTYGLTDPFATAK